MIIWIWGWARTILPRQFRYRTGRDGRCLPKLDTPIAPQAPFDKAFGRRINVADCSIANKRFQGKFDL